MTATSGFSAADATGLSVGESSWSFPEQDTRAVRYEIIGPRGAPVVAVLGGISASKHVASSPSDSSAGWWEDVVGPGRPIDTRQFRVLSIDYITLTLSPPPSIRPVFGLCTQW